MPSDDSSVGDALSHQSLKVSPHAGDFISQLTYLAG